MERNFTALSCVLRWQSENYRAGIERLAYLSRQLIRPIEGIDPVPSYDTTPEFTDIVLLKDESCDFGASDENKLIIRTTDGFEVCILRYTMPGTPSGTLPDYLWLNGYVTVPDEMCELANYIRTHDYDDVMEQFPDMRVELSCNQSTIIGWDHGHIYDINLAYPVESRENNGGMMIGGFKKRVSGPPQVLEEARYVIHSLRGYPVSKN